MKLFVGARISQNDKAREEVEVAAKRRQGNEFGTMASPINPQYGWFELLQLSEASFGWQYHITVEGLVHVLSLGLGARHNLPGDRLGSRTGPLHHYVRRVVPSTELEVPQMTGDSGSDPTPAAFRTVEVPTVLRLNSPICISSYRHPDIQPYEGLIEGIQQVPLRQPSASEN